MSEAAIAHLTNADAIMGALIRAVGPCNLEVDLDCAPFQSLAQAIAHQQLNGTAARTILNRFVASIGADGAFPTPQQVLAAPQQSLRAAGFSFAKIAALRDLAAKTLEGVVPEHDILHALPDLEVIERLTQVRGIGRWTVEMMLMFRLGRPDILPVDDFGVRTGFKLAYGLRQMPLPKVLAEFGVRWGPHRSAAAWYLWRAVELARAGKLPAPAERIQLPRVKRKRKQAKKSPKIARRSRRKSVRNAVRKSASRAARQPKRKSSRTRR